MLEQKYAATVIRNIKTYVVENKPIFPGQIHKLAFITNYDNII